MSTEKINQEVARIKQNVADCYALLDSFNATLPQDLSIDNLADCIDTIPSNNIITQSGDTIITTYGYNNLLDKKILGAKLQHTGIYDINSLNLDYPIPATLFADDGNSTVKFTTYDLEGYING